MRTNIEIDHELMQEALRRSGLTSKRAVVEESLRLLVRLKRQEEMRELRGKIDWQGDLDQSRLGGPE